MLPLKALDGDFPSAFVRDFVHWLNISTGEIEWRPFAKAWDTSPDNWWMTSDLTGPRLQCGRLRLIDIRSPTAKVISQLLMPLELATHIHIAMDIFSREVEIMLPRLKLEFTLAQPGAILVSKQYREMAIDENQSFGAFTGLETKLVLRDTDGKSRIVVVPNGPVTFKKHENHVTVRVDVTHGTDIDYHVFRIDKQLCRLVDNGSTKSRLFRIYLHALTSHCLVDTLTGRTGTEEALENLSAAATLSFLGLTTEELKLLDNIANLTPKRQYYPHHLRVMQQVQWAPLPPLSQHISFVSKVAYVLQHAGSLQMFSEGSSILPAIQKIEEYTKNELHCRQGIRDATFQVDGFGDEEYTTAFDMAYTARDFTHDSSREANVCYTASLVDAWSSRLRPCTKLLSKIESWITTMPGLSVCEDVSLGFSTELLEPLSHFLPNIWCALHAKLGNTTVS
jgi:hypothetical protein